MVLSKFKNFPLYVIYATFVKNWHLIKQLARRQILRQYRGSVLGLVWSFINPVVLLGIYTFVFGVVFKSRWRETGNENLSDFAIILYAGMLVFNIFSESINSAPKIIVENTNFVKKVIFPIEILPLVNIISVLFQAAINFIVLLVAEFAIMGNIPWTVIFFPLICIPLVLITLGIMWILASLGVFLRDISQLTVLFTTVLTFATPIFYNVDKLPKSIQLFFSLNPLAVIIDSARKVVIWGETPDWRSLFLWIICGLLVLLLGFYWFQKTRKAFADVL